MADLKRTYDLACERYANVGVSTDSAIRRGLLIPISVQCWQADAVRGLERRDESLSSGGIQATGSYPGFAKTGDEIRQDFDQAAKFMPGPLKLNLHAMYAETGRVQVDRDVLSPVYFQKWIDWAKERGYGLDFNPTYFAHPRAADGLTLSHPNGTIRYFWIRHGVACRKIGQHFGQVLGKPCVVNHWMPDGRKDSTADRWTQRELMIESLRAILSPDLGIDSQICLDAVESKLFGIGVEDYTVGSHELMLLLAQSCKVMPCFDMGHFHPTESVADKLSATLLFFPNVLLHISRGIRWDSDHVPLFNDEIRAICDEVVRGRATDRIFWATDFFDASINHVAAWVIGVRALRKAMLYAFLEPYEAIRSAELEGDGAKKLALLEQRSELPFGAVWQELCQRAGVPSDLEWLEKVKRYEVKVLSQRK